MSTPRSFSLDAYVDDVQKQLGSKLKILRALGEGQNSIAFAIQDEIHHSKRCLKTISPSLMISSDRREAGKKLEKEVATLSKLSHRCLPQIFDSNFLVDLPYYICSYHPGDTWDKICSGNTQLKIQFRLDHIFYIISSIFDTFEYLHQQKVAHGDFHAKNILVGENIYRDGILIIDFGSSDSINTDRRSADFSSIGRTLLLFKDKFFENSSHEQYTLFVNFCHYLISDQSIDWAAAKRRLDYVIDPRFLATQTEFLFSRQDGSRGHISLPASQPLPIGQAVQDIIDTDVFQRLRGVRQLSFCDWEYPGATHTRYEHSLGVYGVTKQALDFLGRDEAFRQTHEPRDIAAALSAALLHDVGHYPFAHVVEHYVANRYHEIGMREQRRNVNHLTFSKEIINTDPEVRKVLKSWGGDVSHDVIRILENQAGVLSQLLDGAVDCDKIDYLKRDSYHCGLAYGSGFDGAEIINGFRCSYDGNSLYFAASAVPAIEGFMILQDQMLSNVYWHANVRAIFAMFHRFIDATLLKDYGKIVNLVQDLRQCSNEYEAVTKVFMPLASNRKNKDHLLKFVLLHLSPRAQDVFRPIATFTVTDQFPQKYRGRNIFNTIVNTGGGQVTGPAIEWKEVQHVRTSFKDALQEKNIIVSTLDILVDIPWGKNKPRMVEIIEPGNEREPTPITKRSHLSESIFLDPAAFSAPIRVFVPSEIAKQAASKLESIRHSALERFYSEKAPLSEELQSELE